MNSGIYILYILEIKILAVENYSCVYIILYVLLSVEILLLIGIFEDDKKQKLNIIFNLYLLKAHSLCI